jgi:hypothetical protein
MTHDTVTEQTPLQRVLLSCLTILVVNMLCLSLLAISAVALLLILPSHAY